MKKSGRPATLTRWHMDEIFRMYVREKMYPRDIAIELGGGIKPRTVSDYVRRHKLLEARAGNLEDHEYKHVDDVVKDRVDEKIKELFNNSDLSEYINNYIPELSKKALQKLEEIIDSVSSKDADKIAASRQIFQIAGLNYAPKKQEDSENKKEYPVPEFNIVYGSKSEALQKKMPDYIENQAE